MDRKKTVLVLFFVILFIVPGLNHGLWRPDEPRVAGISAEMARTNDFVVPKINGRPFLEKPALYFMATSHPADDSLARNGLNDTASRPL